MGLIQAALGSAGGVLADQWKEYFYCDALPADVQMRAWLDETAESMKAAKRRSSKLGKEEP